MVKFMKDNLETAIELELAVTEAIQEQFYMKGIGRTIILSNNDYNFF